MKTETEQAARLLPRAAAALVKAAEERGWEVRTTYGQRPSIDGIPAAASVAVRLRRGRADEVGAWRAVARWDAIGRDAIDAGAYKFALGYVWSQGAIDPRKIGARDLAKFVKGVES